jgi:prepilin peptidase CpaA
MITLSATAALWILLFAVPLSFIAAYNDLARMKLPNAIVLALVAAYVVFGPFLFEFETYLWGFARGVVMYFVGMFAFMFMGIGAGDGKFAAAMALFIPLADATLVLAIFCGFLLAAFCAHRLLRAIPRVREATPHWVSWEHRKFPAGLAITGTFITYLGLAAAL